MFKLKFNIIQLPLHAQLHNVLPLVFQIVLLVASSAPLLQVLQAHYQVSIFHNDML
jgi:hypothetical protein